MDTDVEKPSLITVEVEVCLRQTSTARPSEIKDRMRDVLESCCRGGGLYTPGPIPATVLAADELLSRHVLHARICEIISPDPASRGSVYLQSAGYYEADLCMFVFGEVLLSCCLYSCTTHRTHTHTHTTPVQLLVPAE